MLTNYREEIQQPFHFRSSRVGGGGGGDSQLLIRELRILAYFVR